MRPIFTFTNEQQARQFSIFLSQRGIENRCEPFLNKDWGKDEFGTFCYTIWIIEEDQIEEANKFLADFTQNPGSPIFQNSLAPLLDEPFLDQKIDRMAKPTFAPVITRVTYFILFMCSLIFVIDTMTTPAKQELPAFLPPLVNVSPIAKLLSYDFPKSFALADQLVALYGINALNTPDELPPQGKKMLIEYLHTPFWTGFYNEAMGYLLSKKDHTAIPSESPPLFEKIREGQIWRLFTPCLMHYDIFHILFNMLWFLVLGKQMEIRMNNRRFLLFILITGILSNTCQYLMSGANFMGFSGVLCGMLAFVWIRQKKVPEEGYQIPKSTFVLILIFVLSMFAIQLVSFFSEIAFQKSFSPGIANTAHLSGAFVGYILGRYTQFFRAGAAIP